MGEETDRPQDVGRRRKRTRILGVEDVALLDRWQAALRRDLGRILDELEPAPAGEGQLDLSGAVPAQPLDVKRATPLYELGIKLSKELGTAILPAGDDPAAQAPRRPKRRPDFG